MIRLVLPAPLRLLARIDGELEFDIGEPATQRRLLDALEARYPALRGTTRDHVTQRRRAYLRYYACGRDVSDDGPDAPLPEAVALGREPFVVIGAMSGG